MPDIDSESMVFELANMNSDTPNVVQQILKDGVGMYIT